MKLFYTIGEVAEMFSVNTSLLRYWETEFPQLKPKKNAGGTRSYTEKDIAVIRRIYHLTKECGYTLEGAREQLKHPTAEDANLTAPRPIDEETLRLNQERLTRKRQAVAKLQEARRQLVALKEELQEQPTE